MEKVDALKKLKAEFVKEYEEYMLKIKLYNLKANKALRKIEMLHKRVKELEESGKDEQSL